MLNGVTCQEIAEGNVMIVTGEGREETLQADTVILAAGYQANNNLFQELQGKVSEVYCIGDASRPQRIREAVNDGYRTGLSL